MGNTAKIKGMSKVETWFGQKIKHAFLSNFLLMLAIILFEDSGAFFDLPQGDRWIADKEIVPLSGELPGMALGLMKSLEKNKLYWRVIGRRSTGKQAISGIRSFSIKLVTGG